MRLGPQAATSLAGAAAAAGVYAALRAAVAAGRLGGPARWERTNHRGETVTLLEGLAYAVAATLAAALAPGAPPRTRAAALVAGAAAGGFGALDDLAGSGDRRGLRGHLAALRAGEVTTGAVKVAGIGAAGLGAGLLLRRDPVDAVLAGGVVAGTANLLNLLDLRPGRAAKAGLLLSLPGLARPGTSGALLAGPAGAAVAVLPADLRERAMLGDAGANAMGALIGVAAAAGASRRGLGVRLGVLVALTAASERVSFTRVIAATPGLRELDRLGRRPPAAPE